jgi:two-component system cell cycle response regulator DivK
VGQKILVVEDNELNLKLFCDLLRAHDYEAEPVRDGREAVARARSFGPDLVIMDIQMPYISGLELIEQLKGDVELRHMPIMAVTAYAAKGDEERIRDAGAEGYVSKPISLMRFIEAVRSLLPLAEDEPAAVPDVTVSQAFPVAQEGLFDAWLDVPSLGEWLFATPDGEMVRVEARPEAGGTFEIVERREGEDVLHTGTYEEIERPGRLVFTLQVPKYSDRVERVTVAIAAAEGGSELTLTQTLAPDAAEMAEAIAQGWLAILDALAARLDQPQSEADEPTGHSRESGNPEETPG